MGSPPHENIPNDGDSPLQIPATPDKRKPQLDEAICRCRAGCACATSRGGGEGDSDGGGPVAGGCLVLPVSAVDEASDDGRSDDGNIDGDEGLAERKIQVGDLGDTSLKEIREALAKHNRCACYGGILPDGDDYPFTAYNSPSASGFLSGDSMIVELSGDERSMSSVSLALSGRSGSSHGGALGRASPSGLFGFVGEHFEVEQPTPSASNFYGAPIWLGHERGYCMNMEIGATHRMYYAPELSFGESASSVDHSEYDMW